MAFGQGKRGGEEKDTYEYNGIKCNSERPCWLVGRKKKGIGKVTTNVM
jgi:hypothetical protein